MVKVINSLSPGFRCDVAWKLTKIDGEEEAIGSAESRAEWSAVAPGDLGSVHAAASLGGGGEVYMVEHELI